MKRTSKLVSVSLAFVLLLTGCNKPSSSSGSDVNDSELYTGGSITYAEDIIIDQPDLDEVCTFTLTNKKAAASDSLKVFDEIYDKYCKDKFSQSELDEKKKVISPDLEYNDDVPYPNCYPKVSDHMTEISENKIDVSQYYIDDPKLFLAVLNGNLHVLDKGNTYSYMNEQGMLTEDGSVNNDSVIGMFFPDHLCDTTAEYFTASDDKVKLSDGEITIAQAEEKALGYLGEMFSDSELKPHISQAKVIDMKGRAGITFFVTNEYKGVAFDANEMKKSGIASHSDYSNGKEYENMPATAFMDSSDTLEIVAGYNNRLEISEQKKADIKISLNEATKIADETFSSNLKLNIRRIELVYCMEKTETGDGVDVVAAYSCYPVWKLSANATNSGTALSIYVNAQTGECYYYENV